MEPSGKPAPPWPLFAALAFGIGAAALAGPCLPAAAAVAALGWLVACHSTRRGRGAGLVALPAVLAAVTSPPSPTSTLPLGPVRVQAALTDVWRSPATNSCTLHLRGDGPRRLVVQGDLDALPGDRIVALARVTEAPCPDRPRRLSADAANVRVLPAPWSLRRAIATLRRHCERALLQFVPGESGAMLATLVLGRGTRPGDDVAAAHRDTGLSHLLAVSGAHAAMLAQLLGLSSHRRGQRLRRGRAYTITVLLVLATYAAVAGAEPPVVRAVLGYGLASLAMPLGRPLGLAIGLGVPALLTCFVAPDALLGPSFLLSYAAVLGLALAAPPAPGSGWRGWLRAAFTASFWAAAATAPLTLFWFGQLAPWTVLLTPLLAPTVALLLFGGLTLCVLAAAAPALAEPLGIALAVVADGYAAAVTTADSLPGTPVPASSVPPPWLLVVTAFGAALPLWFAGRRLRRATLAALAIACAPFFVPLGGARHDRLRLFAVGHGQAALLETRHGGRAVIDCGSQLQAHLAARRLLDALPVRWLDVLVLTHGDADHHNAVAALLGPVHIGRAIVPQGLVGGELTTLLQGAGVPVTPLAPGASCEPLPGLLVSAPPLPAGAADNDQSLWCRLQVGPVSVLLPGDAQAVGIAAALAAGIATPADVLGLPHHGRADPLAPRLLQRVAPRACFASAAGADGDTAQGALARRQGAELFVTGQVGTIELTGEDRGRVRTSEAWRPLQTR